MKKLAIFLAMMIIPFTAFALDTISDLELDNLTGQAGVSIFLTTVRIETTPWIYGYGDENENHTTTNWLLQIDNGRTQEISFLGSRTLDIDIISRAEFTSAIATNTVPGIQPGDYARFGGLEMSILRENTAVNSDHVSDSAVMISLPNGIRIVDFGELKTVGLVQAVSNKDVVFGDGSDGQVQVLLKAYNSTTAGGTTTISGAGGADAANNIHIAIMAHD